MTQERPRLRQSPPTTPTFAEFERGLTIDEHGLQVECRNQPELFYHVARAFADARAEYEDAKNQLKRTSADIELTTRQNLEQSETRITEARITALVVAHEDAIRASDKVTECRVRLDQLEALKEAYMQRKDMLRELVQLFISNYYSDPARGNENRMRDIATEGVRAARRREQEQEQQSRRR